jgi:hypothetical protein
MRILQFTCLALALLLTGSAPSGGQTPSPTPSGGVLRFHNGSVLRPVVLLDAVEIETKFGKVRIPASEIRRIDFGFRNSDEDAKKIEQALTDLSSEQYQTRAGATKTLTAMKRSAYPALLTAEKTGDHEFSKRVEAILKEIRSQVPTDRLHTRRTDIVRTSDSVVTGQMSAVVIRCRCELFGEVKVPLWQLRDLSSEADASRVAVDAAMYGNRTTWMDTGFEANRDTRLEITTTGQINLDPNNTLMNALFNKVGPDGHPQLNTGEGIGGVLMGRIGTDGPVFVVGSRYSGVPQIEGKLFLRIITLEPTNNLKAQGSYMVDISSQPK